MVRIKVSQEEMLNLLRTYTLINDNTHDLLEHIYTYGFIFNEFALIWENTYTFKVKIEGVFDEQIIHIKKIYKKKSGRTEHRNIDFTLPQFLNNMAAYLKEAKNIKDVSKISKQIVDDTWSADYLPVISFMLYALHKAQNQEVITKDHTDRIFKSKPKKKSESVNNKEYTLNEVVRHYQSHINHSIHNITCPKWDVKGHFRHYKNGKVTWISPYIKGKDREAHTESRTYVVKELKGV